MEINEIRMIFHAKWSRTHGTLWDDRFHRFAGATARFPNGRKLKSLWDSLSSAGFSWVSDKIMKALKGSHGIFGFLAFGVATRPFQGLHRAKRGLRFARRVCGFQKDMGLVNAEPLPEWFQLGMSDLISDGNVFNYDFHRGAFFSWFAWVGKGLG